MTCHPFPEADGWSRTLKQIALEPLELRPDFPQIARRHEAWWAREAIDGPLVFVTAARDPRRNASRRLDLLQDPDAWFEAKFGDLRNTVFYGDALPFLRVDFGPVLLGALVGGRTEIGADTTWTHPCISDDWSDAPDGTIRDDHPWWSLLLRLLERVAEDARGRYLACSPDLGGSGDILLNLRGSQEICLDLLDQPERVESALAALYPSWRRAFGEVYRRTVGRGAGLVHWLGLWSERPYVITACDLNALIGPEDFGRILLPDIVRQATDAGRSIFHLDGPDAARHVDALLDAPGLDAIQFTPGAQDPSALRWTDMFRKIQERGRALYVCSPPTRPWNWSAVSGPRAWPSPPVCPPVRTRRRSVRRSAPRAGEPFGAPPTRDPNPVMPAPIPGSTMLAPRIRR